MQFGRVIGVITPLIRASDEPMPRYRLNVTIETGPSVTVVRSEVITPGAIPGTRADPDWIASQWTQETIGNELAADGWEPIGTSDEPIAGRPDPGSGQSPTFIVRRR